LGADLRVSAADHLEGTVDPESRRGAFGYEYHGRMPRGRWLITKTDLLVAQAVGYKLRETTALARLQLTTDKLPAATVSAPYGAQAQARGGVPFYHWEIVAGALPPGLLLDSFTGQIKGTPRREGEFEFTLQVRDYDEHNKGQRRRLCIRVIGR
jgi:hypothetical protein